MRSTTRPKCDYRRKARYSAIFPNPHHSSKLLAELRKPKKSVQRWKRVLSLKFRHINRLDKVKIIAKTDVDGSADEIVVTPAVSEKTSQNLVKSPDTIPTLSNSASSATLVEKSETQELEKASTEGKEAPISDGVPTGDVKNTPDAENKKDDPKKVQGWPERTPFSHGVGGSSREKLKEFTFWGDLTLQEKIAYRKEFLREYLSETKKCFPYVRKLFMMIYRISPWRAAVILTLNVINGLIPALTLQTRGSFILMVHKLPNLR